jgi:uncharacterized protein YgbK (DUF1537 family)
VILGAIGDDFTGSSDLANTLAKSGLQTVQYCGQPDSPADPDVEAGVVALKTRSIPAADAVAQSLAALDWLRAQGCQQIVFKYCSTFDSTDAGNIGPVAEALAKALDARGVVVCPAFPATGRTVYQGHLFVGDVLLSDSGMRDHPLTPMTDPDLRRVLARQTPEVVGHVPLATVQAGADAVRAALASDTRFMIVDAVSELDLHTIGAACKGARLVTGGSGIAIGLAANFRTDSTPSRQGQDGVSVTGPVAVLAGSVSTTTRKQIATHIALGHPALRIRAAEVMAGSVTAADLASYCLSQNESGVPLVYSSADPADVAAAQSLHGSEAVAAAFETIFGETARMLVAKGCRQLVCAGGETSGAIVTALGLRVLRIGPEIDPGVPALSADALGLRLVLKSGNFGSPDFFSKAAAMVGAKS